MKKFWQDFKKFITRGNVVDMAVGVAVASAFTAIVTSVTKGFISPLLAIITGSTNLVDMKWVYAPEVLDEAGNVVSAEIAFLWGEFLQKIIDFLIIALTLFIVLRIVSGVAARAAKLRERAYELANKEQVEAEAAAAEIAKAEAAAKAEAEAKAKAEAEAAEAAKIKAEEDRLHRQEQLLTEIRDLLENK